MYDAATQTGSGIGSKLVKFTGQFVWHHHQDEDELFLVIKGSFRMEFCDRSVEVGEGEIIVIPDALRHL